MGQPTPKASVGRKPPQYEPAVQDGQHTATGMAAMWLLGRMQHLRAASLRELAHRQASSHAARTRLGHGEAHAEARETTRRLV